MNPVANNIGRNIKERMGQELNKEPMKCACGQIVAYKRGNVLYLYCKRCKRQIPIKIEPEPRARATEE